MNGGWLRQGTPKAFSDISLGASASQCESGKAMTSDADVTALDSGFWIMFQPLEILTSLLLELRCHQNHRLRLQSIMQSNQNR